MTPVRPSSLWSIFAVLIFGVLSFLIFLQLRELNFLRRTETARAEVARKTIVTLREELAKARAAVRQPSSGHAMKAAGNAIDSEVPPKTSDQDQTRRKLSRARMLGRLADVFAGLKISPEKREALKNLLLEKYAASADASNAAYQLGIQMDTQEMYKAIFAADAPADAAIKSLLSDDEYRSFSTLMEQHLVNSYLPDTLGASGALIDAGVPLTSDQITSLARAYYQMSEISFAGNPPSVQLDAATGISPAQQYLLEQASSSLSTDQMNALRNYFISVANPDRF